MSPRKGRVPVPTEDRFWSKVVKTDGCWMWTGGILAGRTWKHL